MNYLLKVRINDLKIAWRKYNPDRADYFGKAEQRFFNSKLHRQWVETATGDYLFIESITHDLSYPRTYKVKRLLAREDAGIVCLAEFDSLEEAMKFVREPSNLQ